MKPITPGTLVVDRNRPNWNGVILTCINEGETDDIALQGLRYYVATDRGVWSVTQDNLKVTQEGHGLSEEQEIRFAKYLIQRGQKDQLGAKTNGNSGVVGQTPWNSKEVPVYRDSAINLFRSAYPGQYVLYVKPIALANKINTVLQIYPVRFRKGEEPQFHLTPSQLNDAIKAMGSVRGEKVYSAIRGGN